MPVRHLAVHADAPLTTAPHLRPEQLFGQEILLPSAWAQLRHLGRRRSQLVVLQTASVQRIRDFLSVAWPVVTETCAGPLQSRTWLAALEVVTSRCGGNPAALAPMGADAFTRTHAQWFKDQGRWGDTPKPGAVVFFSWSGSKSIDSIDHVGMVMKDLGNGSIQTIEGNTDNAVKIRTRDASSVVGYGYPEYGDNTA